MTGSSLASHLPRRSRECRVRDPGSAVGRATRTLETAESERPAPRGTGRSSFALVGSVPARRDLDGALGEARALRVALDALPGVGDDRRVVRGRGRILLDDARALRDLDRLVPADRVERADAG